MGHHRQIDAKLEAPPEVAVPDLSGLPGVASADPGERYVFEAAHWDTPDLRLTQARITLRRRSGGPDDGWQLNVPVSADEWLDVRAPPGQEASGVPAGLAAVIAARVRESTLQPVATLRTARTVRRLRDAHGRVLLEVADDAVTSTTPTATAAVVDAWREWDIELVQGDRDLLARALTRLRSAGGSSPQWPSKLTRALGDRLVATPAESPDDQLDPRCAGAVVREHLASLRDLLLVRDPRVRRDQPGAAQQMLVVIRQLRAALATFRPVLERGPSELMRTELGWLAGLLGADRDAQTAGEGLTDLVAREPADLVLGPVAERLTTSLAAERAGAHHRVLEALGSVRYYRLLDALDALVAAGPLPKDAAKPAVRVLPGLVRHDWERLAKAWKAASSALPGADRDRHLHSAFTASARVRYAADVVVPTMGGSADKFARSAKELQSLLANHDDLLKRGALLLNTGIEASAAGESSFTYGRLHAVEQARAAHLEERISAVWNKISAPRRRRWMS
ncbi:CYTH and CHAD domain-containing protein [Pengzhenrongella frigida]|uniref:CYTH and CHAD domain-containing protein n=1 Tax=Pengzhenrongella frigida TaxID=1259133 RepID=A0A4V1ZGU4_9MICO|nr:CYTH and CHAD domain-containing protein [Cellulomonas sp. HLT2-17]RYV49754.1 CYTH and CHAD domain-containing protein [Cellulomonas sp. HLT2-17]